MPKKSCQVSCSPKEKAANGGRESGAEGKRGEGGQNQLLKVLLLLLAPAGGFALLCHGSVFFATCHVSKACREQLCVCVCVHVNVCAGVCVCAGS